MTHPEYGDPVPERIALRYERRRSSPPEALARPIWFRDIAEAVWEIKRREEGGSRNICNQLKDRVFVLSRSLILREPEDVVLLEKIKQSMIYFAFGGITMERTAASQRNVAELFAWEVVEWMKEGLDGRYVAEWLKIIGNFPLIDPSLISLISPGSVINRITPLSGLVKGVDFSADPQIVGAHLREMEAEQMLRIRLAIPSNISPFYTVAAFMNNMVNACEELIGTYPDQLGETEMHEKDVLGEIRDSARSSSVFLEQMRRRSFSNLEIMRPTSHDQIMPLVAGAMADWLSNHHVGEYRRIPQREIDELAEAILGVYRRRRILPSSREVLGFCADFLRGDGKEVLTGIEFGKGLQTLVDCSESYIESELIARRNIYRDWSKTEQEEYRNKYRKTMAEVYAGEVKRVIQSFLLRLQTRAMSEVPLTNIQYHHLGFGNDIWLEHEQAREAASKKRVPGVEVLSKGDTVVEITGQFGPITGIHLEIIREVTRMAADDLRELGLEVMGTGRVWVGVGVNSGNPLKKTHEDALPLSTRMAWVQKSLMGLEGVFLWRSPVDVPGCSEVRLKHHLKVLVERGIKPTQIIRMAGTDHLDPETLTYTEVTEPGGHDLLNVIPTIFLLQADDLRSLGELAGIVGKIKKGHPNSVIVIAPNPEVHGQYIRELIGDEDNPRALSTLVHPAIAPGVYITLRRQTISNNL